MNIFSFVGYSNSGKTRLIQRLVKDLATRGYSAGVIKCCTHSFDLSPEGKDSQLFLAAGAEAAAILGSEQWAVMGGNLAGLDIAALAEKQFSGLDIIFVEGGRHYSGTKKIGLLRQGVVEELSLPEEQLIAVVSDIVCDFTKPVFHPDDINGIIDFLLEEIGK